MPLVLLLYAVFWGDRVSDHDLLIVIAAILLFNQMGGWPGIFKNARQLAVSGYFVAFTFVGFRVWDTWPHADIWVMLLLVILALPYSVWVSIDEYRRERTPENIARQAEERARMKARVKSRRQMVASWFRGRRAHRAAVAAVASAIGEGSEGA